MANTPGSGSLVLSYLALRKSIGVLGLALPFALALGALALDGAGLQPSVSHYYYTAMRNVFVGTLCAIAVFLLSYFGYERRDAVAGDVAGVLALGVAFFPTTPDIGPSPAQRVDGVVHLVCAAGFFLTLSYFSLCLFTKKHPTLAPTPQKLQRNRVYRVCGSTMLTAIALIALYHLLPGGVRQSLAGLAPVFWLETFAIVAFGVSWLTKGEAILKDQT